jgi:flagellar protein FliS
MPKEEVTLQLYEGALKFANQCIIALEHNEMEKCHELNIKVQNIIREFMLTLNHDYKISKELNVMYDYIHARLIEANIQKNKEILEEVRDLVRELRDTWREAIKLARVGSAAADGKPKTVRQSADITV